MRDALPILHVYSPTHWHAAAMLVGTRKAFEDLRWHLDVLLGASSPTPCERAGGEYLVRDGEGFALRLCLMTEEEINQSPLPYTNLPA